MNRKDCWICLNPPPKPKLCVHQERDLLRGALVEVFSSLKDLNRIVSEIGFFVEEEGRQPRVEKDLARAFKLGTKALKKTEIKLW